MNKKLKKFLFGGVTMFAMLGFVAGLLTWYFPRKDKDLTNGVNKIDITTTVTHQDVKEIKAKLYGGGALRRLEPLETGKQPDQLPDGVYFFLDSLEIRWLTVKPYNKDSVFAESIGDSGRDYEIQKFGGELYLIGFISDEAFANVGSLRNSSTSYAVAPIAWDGGRNAVAIPFSAINIFSDRYINIGVSDHSTGSRMQIIDLVYTEAIQNPTVYTKPITK